MKKFKLIVPLIFLIITLIPLFWYRQDSIITGGDMGLPLDYKYRLEKGISAWDNSIKTGKNVVFGLSGLQEFYIIKLISFTGLSANKIEIIYFSFLVFGILSGFYFFARQIVKEYGQENNFLLPLIGSVFYLFNFFSITRWEGFDRPILYQMIGVPLMLGLMIKNLRKESLANYFFLGIASIVLCYSVVNLPSFSVGIIIILLFNLCLLMGALWKKNFIKFKKIIYLGFKTLLVMFVCNLFWIVPVLGLGDPKSVFESVAPLDWLVGISQSCSLKNVIRLMGAWYWYDSSGDKPYAPYAQIYQFNSVFVVLTYLVPLLCLVGLFFSWKKKNTYFLIPVLFVGLVFSMGENGPFGKIYRFLYDKIIFFRIFRSPWFKFSLLTILAYSFYYGLFSTEIYIWVKNRLPKIVSFFLAILFFSFPIVLSHPLVKAPYYENFRVKVPNYAKDAARFFDENLKDGQRLYLYSFGQNDGYTWGYAGILPVLFHLSKWPTLGPWYNIHKNDLSDKLVDLVDLRLKIGSEQGISNYLSYLGVKYLILRKDILGLEKEKEDYIEEQVKKQAGIDFVKSFIDWDVYQNRDPFPLFSLGSKLINISDNETFLKIVGSEDTGDTYCINCLYQLGVVNRYNMTPKDFIKKENGTREYEFEILEDTEYLFSVKLGDIFKDNPVVYLDGSKLILQKGGEENELIGKKVLSCGKHVIKLEESIFPKKNFIVNGDFSKSLEGWDYFDEGTYYGLPIKSSLNLFGLNSVNLEAFYKTAIVGQKITGLDANKKYRLRFTVKSLGNLPLQVGISVKKNDPTVFIVDPQYHKYNTAEETIKEIIFIPKISDFFVNFYARVLDTTPNSHLIGNISLEEAGPIETIDIIPVVSKIKKDLSFSKKSPTSFSLNISTDSSGWLTYNNACDKGWKAFENKVELKHLCVNGFANGYFVSRAGEHKIELVYYPQKLFAKASLISKLFVVVLALLALRESYPRLVKKSSSK